jgi:hypothetical protein
MRDVTKYKFSLPELEKSFQFYPYFYIQFNQTVTFDPRVENRQYKKLKL